MAILLTSETRAIIQGITGRVGAAQAKWMLDYGTNLVAGVTPGQGGASVHGVPVYDDVAEAVERHGANATVIFVPAAMAKDAVFEAIEAGIRLVVFVTEHVPVRDAMQVRRKANEAGAVVLGPNTPGIITPGVGKLGIMPGNMFAPGRIGVVSRSGTLSYEVSGHMNAHGFGQSTLVGIGGDPVICTDLVDVLAAFDEDETTEAVVVVGEIGGDAEERAASFIAKMKKPVVAYIAGKTAPKGRRMGHAGAIIAGEGERGTAESKMKTLSEAGALIAESPADVPIMLKRALRLS